MVSVDRLLVDSIAFVGYLVPYFGCFLVNDAWARISSARNEWMWCFGGWSDLLFMVEGLSYILLTTDIMAFGLFLLWI